MCEWPTRPAGLTARVHQKGGVSCSVKCTSSQQGVPATPLRALHDLRSGQEGIYRNLPRAVGSMVDSHPSRHKPLSDPSVFYSGCALMAVPVSCCARQVRAGSWRQWHLVTCCRRQQSTELAMTERAARCLSERALACISSCFCLWRIAHAWQIHPYFSPNCSAHMKVNAAWGSNDPAQVTSHTHTIPSQPTCSIGQTRGNFRHVFHAKSQPGYGRGQKAPTAHSSARSWRPSLTMGFCASADRRKSMRVTVPPPEGGRSPAAFTMPSSCCCSAAVEDCAGKCLLSWQGRRAGCQAQVCAGM